MNDGREIFCVNKCANSLIFFYFTLHETYFMNATQFFNILAHSLTHSLNYNIEATLINETRDPTGMAVGLFFKQVNIYCFGHKIIKFI